MLNRIASLSQNWSLVVKWWGFDVLHLIRNSVRLNFYVFMMFELVRFSRFDVFVVFETVGLVCMLLLMQTINL